MTTASPPKRAFILDFDGTITVKDTISFLFQIGLSKQASLGVDKTEVHEAIISKYSEDFFGHLENYRLVKEDRRTLHEEVDYYRSLKEVEVRSFERVSDSGLFGGIKEDEWRSYGGDAIKNGEVSVREGFADFCRHVKNTNSVWGIVSVNFSREFIRGVVDASGSKENQLEILANVSNEKGVLRGPAISSWALSEQIIATCDAKLAAMKCLLDIWKEKAFFGKNCPETLVPVYIGDSGTDIECLADESVVGIVMAENGLNSLVDIAGRIGMAKHVRDFRETDTRRIYWARDFTEILRSPLFM
ncbi:hypothetical protein G7Y89_g14306 [Cudoniella acicularis]|uniref:Haloacid dehalogenase-like hydrolase n=1 Tax=Cudoniella acicularis TaxID=354080 RepID=A0A8H4R5V4_9HELO|nr:hypothetical protein G7Y89_g14306 [Cudoniella acicularis]